MNRTKTRAASDGFTIIELMLALAFVSFILMFIVTATVQVMRSYNKGLVTKQINQTGRTITEDIARTARSAWAESARTNAVSEGRLCIGGTSYVWNEPDIDGGTPITDNVYDDGQPVDIVRVDRDLTASLCTNANLAVPRGNDTSSLSDGSIRLVGMRAEPSTDSRLMSIKFTIATIGDNKPVRAGGDYQCPTNSGSLFGSFCALADFETTVYLRNKNG